MSKREITIVIPSLTPFEGVTVYQTFLQSAIRERLYVQFVYLRNGFHNTSDEAATFEQFDTHEILYVPHDRLFHTAEENLYRIQDFMDLFKPRVFFIGNDDEVDWALFEEALDFFDTNTLGCLGLQVQFKQFNEDGSHAVLPVMSPVNVQGSALNVFERLMNGEVMSSMVAYGAIQSVSGFWWSTYFGNHIYSLTALKKILQFRFKEPICSHMFMQIECFSQYNLRYGFLNKPVVARLGYEFLHMRRNTIQMGGVRNHRTVFGHTVIQNAVYLSGITELEDDATFTMVVNALGHGLHPKDEKGIEYRLYSMLVELCSWSRDILREKIFGKSYYFPELAGSSSLQDLRYVYRFVSRLHECIQKYPAIYQPLTEKARGCIQATVECLAEYHESLAPDILSIKQAHDHLHALHDEITVVRAMEMNLEAYDYYLASRLEQATSRQVLLKKLPAEFLVS